jgi:SNF2 family DNA or RNA helicase
MHDITNETIKLRGALDTTYRKGLGIFSRGEIKNIRSTENLLFFQGIVQGTNRYQVEATFDKQGKIESTRCSCAAYHSYYGDCKHITALLMFIGKYKDPRDTKDNQIRTVIKDYRQMEIDHKSTLNFQVDLRITEGIGETELRIGEETPYIIKDIEEFLQKFRTEESIPFGKNFTYDPYLHRLKGEDQKIMDFFLLLLEMRADDEDLMENKQKTKVFQGKKLMLKNHVLEGLLKLMDHREEGFSLWIDGEYYQGVEFSRESISMDFMLKPGKKSSVVLQKKIDAPIIPLDSINNLVFHEGNIHRLKDSQNQWIRPLLKVWDRKEDPGVEIPKAQAESFITEVLPVLQEHSFCEIQENLAKKIINVPLKAKLFLDQEDKKVIAKLLFTYKDKEINPFFPKEETEKQKEFNALRKILLRDKSGEARLLELLEEGEFHVEKGRCYMEAEEKIFYFLERLLPKLLQEPNLSIYYSDDFKKVKSLRNEDIQRRISLNHGLNLLECSIDMADIPKNEIMEILKSLKEKVKYHRLASGTFLALSQEKTEKLFDWFDEMELELEDFTEGKAEIPKYKAFEIDELLKDEEDTGFVREESFKEFLESYQSLSGETGPGELLKEELALPKGLQGTLRNYQKKGFQWISTLSDYGFGGILADEMGLGKTIQALSYLLKEKEKGAAEPGILVVPTSLVYNWEDEIHRFSPDLKTLTISGSRDEREEKIQRIEEYDLILTSYPLLRRDIELYQRYFFHACILDEAQHIKNKSSQTAKAVKSLKGKKRFVLTGTPLENNLTELWSIFDFLIPGYLGSYKEFTENYQKPIGKNNERQPLIRLKRKVEPFILRRLKGDVLQELPAKVESKILVDMTKEQQKLYRLYLQRIKGEIRDLADEDGIKQSHIQILAGLTRLRQISCHPGVFIENYQGGSGKLQVLEEILEQGIAANHRLLIFSQFTGVLKMVREDLERKGYDTLYLDGSVPMEQRGDLVKAFNKGEVPIFLISLKAGGTGLNLTSADMVIHMDPWWNPAVENQATDRAHRMGQKKMVQVKKLIARGTVEEKIHQIQQQKTEIIDQIIQKGETLLSKFTKEELLDLLEG